MSDKIYVTADNIVSPSCDIDSQETVISWTRKDNLATICTSDPTVVTRLKNIMKEDSSYQCYYYANNIDKETGRPFNYFFTCDKSPVTLRRKVDKRELTEEEKEIIAKRLNIYTN